MLGALLLQHEQRALDRADRSLGDIAVFGRELAGAIGQVLQQVLHVLEIDDRQLLVIGDLEGDVEHAFLRLVEIHKAGQEKRPKRGDCCANRVPLVTEQVPKDDGIGTEVLREADRFVARLDPGLHLAFFGDA